MYSEREIQPSEAAGGAGGVCTESASELATFSQPTPPRSSVFNLNNNAEAQFTIFSILVALSPFGNDLFEIQVSGVSFMCCDFVP